MYFKTLRRATCATVALFATACSINPPWKNEPIGQEVNIAFILKNNLLFLPSATVDGRPGRFLFGSADPRTVLDPKFAPDAATHSIQLTRHESVRLAPAILDLHGVGDGIVGADVWSGHAITIDYRAGLLTFQKQGIHPAADMVLYNYADTPMINIAVDGRRISAIVDTASPDTLVLPRGDASVGRRSARVKIADTDFGDVDVQLADVAAARIGNRLLSRFLVSIDYGRRQVGLWRDPRTAL
jgi:hypothetical protein